MYTCIGFILCYFSTLYQWATDKTRLPQTVMHTLLRLKSIIDFKFLHTCMYTMGSYTHCCIFLKKMKSVFFMQLLGRIHVRRTHGRLSCIVKPRQFSELKLFVWSAPMLLKVSKHQKANLNKPFQWESTLHHFHLLFEMWNRLFPWGFFQELTPHWVWLPCSRARRF